MGMIGRRRVQVSTHKDSPLLATALDETTLARKKETLSTQERWHRFYLMTVKALSCNNLTRLIELLRCVSCLYGVFRRKVLVRMEKNKKNEGARCSPVVINIISHDHIENSISMRINRLRVCFAMKLVAFCHHICPHHCIIRPLMNITALLDPLMFADLDAFNR